MPAKKKPEPIEQPNVVIINPETDEMETTNTESEDTTEQPQNLKAGYQTFPTPTESAGKGRKYCPNCNAVMGARSVDCGNCGFHIYKGAAKPAGTTQRKTASKAKTITPIQQTEKPEVSLLRVLKNRGFDVRISIDALDPKSEPEIHVEKSIERIMEFIPYYNANGRFEINLEQLLTLLKLPLNK